MYHRFFTKPLRGIIYFKSFCPGEGGGWAFLKVCGGGGGSLFYCKLAKQSVHKPYKCTLIDQKSVINS